MSDTFTVSVRGHDTLLAHIVGAPAAVNQKLLNAITTLAINLHKHVIVAHLSGPTGAHTLSVGHNSPMHTAGQLQRSLFWDVNENANGVTGIVGFSADTPYAAIHEYGGTINIPEIVPVNAKALHFMIGGQDVFVKRVKAHTVTIPERAPLRTGFAEMIPDIEAGLRQAVREGLGIA